MVCVQLAGDFRAMSSLLCNCLPQNGQNRTALIKPPWALLGSHVAEGKVKHAILLDTEHGIGRRLHRIFEIPATRSEWTIMNHARSPSNEKKLTHRSGSEAAQQLR